MAKVAKGKTVKGQWFRYSEPSITPGEPQDGGAQGGVVIEEDKVRLAA